MSLDGSLRVRLTLFSGWLTSAILLVFAILFYQLLRTNLLSEIDGDLSARAALVERALSESADLDAALRRGAPSALEEFVTPGIYIQMMTATGDTHTSEPDLPGAVTLADRAVLEAVQQDGPTIITRPVGPDERVRVYRTLVADPTGGDALLVVAESLEPVERTLIQARTLLLIGGAFAVALAVGGATILTSRALAPIGRLTEAAAAAAAGNYHERVALPAHQDEVQQLAATINTLLATVERTLDQQRQLLADTSHELRSPLTVVLANLNLLRRDLSHEERDLSLEEATQEAHRMRALVNDLLLLAQADRALAIANQPVRLDALVEDMAGWIARRTPGHTIQAQVEASVTVMGDEERLRQVLRNLLENATNHTPPGTTVRVSLRRSEHLAQIVVADDGPGISAEHLPHIWDRFYRVDKARSRAAGGSGLGLAIVKYIVEAHGGRVDAASASGAGTTFTVLLPLAGER